MSPSEGVKFSNVRGLYLRKYGRCFQEMCQIGRSYLSYSVVTLKHSELQQKTFLGRGVVVVIVVLIWMRWQS